MEDIDRTQEMDQEAALDKLKGYVLGQSDDASSWIESDIAPDRAKATRYYKGEKFGNEEEGRSQIVLTEVRDTVLQLLPPLMRVFFSGERVVEFVPVGPEDVASAEQATDYVNHIVQKDNPGFEVCYASFKDALVRKTGIIKYWWNEEICVTTHEFSGLTDQALAAVLSEQGAELVADRPYPDPSAPPRMDAAGNPVPTFLHDCTVRRTKKKKKVSIAAVPPEEFLINRTARAGDISSWGFVEHRSEKTKGEIVALGYDPDDINWSQERSMDFNQERLARNPASLSFGNNQKKVLYRECWVRYDLDGDGIDELLRVCVAGRELLHVEPTDDIPFAIFCPDPEPNTFFGLSEADKTMDLQEQKSFVFRNMFDSLAQSIHPRTAVVEGQVNMADVLNNETGAIIRMRAPGMVQPLITPFVGQDAFPVVEYLDRIKEQRTGINAASQGLDPDVLQSTTKAAVDATVKGAQARTELIARIFAETGMKRLFTGILKLITKHQDQMRMVRLRNQWVPIDPRYWDATMDVSVNVGIGQGTNEERIGFLGMIAGKQEQIMQLAGPDNPLVNSQNLYNTYGKILELAGWKDKSQFFTDPQTWEPPPPPPPEPQEVLVQAQIEDVRGNLAIKSEDLKLKREIASWDQDLKRDQLDADIILRTKEMEMKYKESVDIATIKANVDKVRKDSPAVVFNDKPKRTRKVPIRDADGEIVAVDEVEIEE
jgi:hypothetical protein